MKKIILLILLTVFSFSDTLNPNRGCCLESDLVDTAGIPPNTIELGSIDVAYQSIPNGLTEYHASHGGNGSSTSSPSICESRGKKIDYLHRAGYGADNSSGSWVKTFPLYKNEYTYNCICNLPDIEPQDPDPTWYPVDEVTELFTLSRIDCVETKQYYKIKEECEEPLVWSELSDGSYGCITPPCVVVNEGDCTESPILDGNKTKPPADCRVGYQLFENSSDEESISCSTLVGDEDLDCYELFPFGDEDYYQTLCVEDGSTETGSDGNGTEGDGDNDGSNNDENSTGDSNSTNPDLSSLEAKLDKINKDNNLNSDRNHKDLTDLEKKLDKINKDNNTNADNEKRANKDASDKAHKDAKDIKDAIIEGNQINSHFYRSIKAVIGNNSVEGGGTADGNSSSNGGSSDGNSSDDNASSPSRKGIDKQNETFAKLVVNSIKTFTDGFNGVQAMLGLIEPPIVNYSGTCELSVAVFHQDASLSDTMKSVLPIFKPILLLILNVTLAFYLVKLSVLVFWDIFNKIYIVF